MWSMSTFFCMLIPMPRKDSTRKPAVARRAYHHGDLPRTMLAEAVRTIDRQGIAALTLRGVGAKLGVSRNALYRHFANKDALLLAVAAEGFRLLRVDLQGAWEQAGGGALGLDAMGAAYIRFAVQHSSHYRVMFGRALGDPGEAASPDPSASGDAFGTLVIAINTLQRAGILQAGDSLQLARYAWAVVHGVSMLAIDGLLRTPADVEAFTQFAVARVRTGIGA